MLTLHGPISPTWVNGHHTCSGEKGGVLAHEVPAAAQGPLQPTLSAATTGSVVLAYGIRTAFVICSSRTMMLH